MVARERGSAFSRFKAKARKLVERRRGPVAPIRHLRELDAHLGTYFGNNRWVCHETASSIVHIDVHIIQPTRERPVFTLVTSGMSDLDMCVPQGVSSPRVSEICLCLPENWALDPATITQATPEVFWPIRMLKQVARYAHANDTWLAEGHTIGSVERPVPFDPAGRFIGVFLNGPAELPPGGDVVQVGPGRSIPLLSVIPILREELGFKLQSGTAGLKQKLAAHRVTELLDPNRASIVPDDLV